MMGIWSSTCCSARAAHPVAALAGDARATSSPCRRASLVVLLPMTVRDRRRSASTRMASTLLWGRLIFGIAARLRPPAPGSRSRSRRRSSRSGVLGLVLMAVDVRAAAQRERALEPPRVPGLARHRPPVAAVAPARAGCARSRGCSRRPGACARSGSRRPAGRRCPTSRCASRSARSTSRSAS